MSEEPKRSETQSPEGPTFLFATLFEAALGFLAVALGWLWQIPVLLLIRFSELDLVLGLGATLPMLLFFFAAMKMPQRSFRELRHLLGGTLGPLLVRMSWIDLLLLAILAGVAEELLFRGFLQTMIEGYLGPIFALLIASLIFGLMHALTPLYAVVATLMGLLLGWIYMVTGSLFGPILSHALYDFVALLGFRYYLKRELLEEKKE